MFYSFQCTGLILHLVHLFLSVLILFDAIVNGIFHFHIFSVQLFFNNVKMFIAYFSKNSIYYMQLLI